MKTHTWFTRAVLFMLCLVLAAATALMATGCNNTDTSNDTPTEPTAITEDVNVLGEGAVSFPFTVTDGDGNSKVYEIRTDRDTVGAALLELGLIEGDEGDYGLYVKTVDGILADYETTGTYWAFYINGEYAMSGVDTTAIEAGASYEMKVEKG